MPTAIKFDRFTVEAGTQLPATIRSRAVMILMELETLWKVVLPD
jgi:hypothetical protein